MPRHPAHIRRTPERVFVFQIEHPFRGDIHVGHIAAGCVNDTFGFSCRTAGVEHEQRMLGFQPLSRTYPGHFGHLVMPPEIARRSHVYRFARTFVYNDAFNGRRARQRLIGIFLQRDNGASPISTVRSDQDAGLRIIDAIAQGFRAEPAKHDIVRYTDTRTREHRDREFRNHPHIDRRAISSFDSERLQNIGEAADLVMQHLIAERSDITGLPFPKDCDLVFRC